MIESNTSFHNTLSYVITDKNEVPMYTYNTIIGIQYSYLLIEKKICFAHI